MRHTSVDCPPSRRHDSPHDTVRNERCLPAAAAMCPTEKITLETRKEQQERRERDAEALEQTRLKVLLALAASVPYADACANAESKLSHVTGNMRKGTKSGGGARTDESRRSWCDGTQAESQRTTLWWFIHVATPIDSSRISVRSRTLPREFPEEPALVPLGHNTTTVLTSNPEEQEERCGRSYSS